jgi:type II secretory pathway component PulF
MRRFRYVAKSKQGEQVEGVIEALDRSAAAAELRAQGLWATTLEPAAGPAAAGWAGSPLYPLWPIAPATMAQFFSQLAAMLRSGITAHDAMGDVTERIGDGRLRRAASEMALALAEGSSLADQMERYPNFFRPHLVGAIRAGETFGGLPEVLADLAEQLTTEATVRGRLRWPKYYYGTVLIIAALVVPFPFIISRGASWYVGLLLTRLLPGLALAGVLMAAAVVVLGLPPMAALRSRIVLGVPLFGALVRWTALVRFTRTLQLSQRAGVTLDQGLEAAGMATGHPAIEHGGSRAAEIVRAGRSLAEALGPLRMLPRSLTGMLAAGERAGNLEEALDRAADWAEERRQASVNAITTGAAAGGLALGAVVVLVAAALGWTNIYRAIFERLGFEW